ncbi:ATP-binding protein [Acetobacter thailandicus]|uniref:ATP-binding protein n=1 Tax=Acetobacter thailandicus TaxID=1502842 RepID=UPI0038CF7A4E
MNRHTRMSVLSHFRRPGPSGRKGRLHDNHPEEDDQPLDDHSYKRLISPLTRRIMLVNILPLLLLAITMLFLNQFRDSLLVTEVTALREQARIYAGALGESAVHINRSRMADNAENFTLDAPIARRLLLRLTEPSPNAHARLFAPDGQLITENLTDQNNHPHQHNHRNSPRRIPPPMLPGPDFFERLMTWGPSRYGSSIVTLDTNEEDIPADPERPADAQGSDSSSPPPPETPPYIRRTADGHLIITVAEPVIHDGKTVGIIQVTRAAAQVDRAVFAIRSSILSLSLMVLIITIMLSWYLSMTIARPLLRLATSARVMRESSGRTGTVPARLLGRRDEIGDVARALQASAQALWKRMDAIERFAADVSHEIKNPLSSIRSAIETLLRIEDLNQQRRLLSIINQDVRRLDRLITDISDASRLDAELSRAQAEPISVTPLFALLAEMQQATRKEHDPVILTESAGDTPDNPLQVMAVEDRLVQVLHNLTGNALSFSPPDGKIILRCEPKGNMVELSVSDEGPGIPPAKLDSIFERFYSERPQTENFGQHSGLGLSISRQILEAMHGKITARNRYNKQGEIIGACFYVILPRASVTKTPQGAQHKKQAQ